MHTHWTSRSRSRSREREREKGGLSWRTGAVWYLSFPAHTLTPTHWPWTFLALNDPNAQCKSSLWRNTHFLPFPNRALRCLWMVMTDLYCPTSAFIWVFIINNYITTIHHYYRLNPNSDTFVFGYGSVEQLMRIQTRSVCCIYLFLIILFLYAAGTLLIPFGNTHK